MYPNGISFRTDDWIDIRDLPAFVDDVIESLEFAHEADTDDEPGSAAFEAEYAEDEDLNAVLELAVELLGSDFGGDAKAAALALEAHGNNYECILVADDDFENYARQFADEIGAVSENCYSWPYCFIDWEAAAESLKSDYQCVTVQGRDFQIRA